MKKSLKVITIALAAAFASTPVLAGQYDQNRSWNNGHQNSYQSDRRHDRRWARVVLVKPIVRTIEVPYQREVCRSYDRYHRDYSGSVAGGVIGGVIGHQFGNGGGNDAATAAGVILGSLAGSQYDRDGRRHTRQQRCRVLTEYRYEEVVKAYKVRYRYRGETYVRRMNNHPGDRIRMNRDRSTWGRLAY